MEMSWHLPGLPSLTRDQHHESFKAGKQRSSSLTFKRPTAIDGLPMAERVSAMDLDMESLGLTTRSRAHRSSSSTSRTDTGMLPRLASSRSIKSASLVAAVDLSGKRAVKSLRAGRHESLEQNEKKGEKHLDKDTNLFLRRQHLLGPQSLRGEASLRLPAAMKHNSHVRACLKKLIKNERHFCGDYAVFYHSYSHAALLYEVQAALAAVLFGFASPDASLPRILFHKFIDAPTAPKLLRSYQQNFRVNKTYDGHSDFMDVGLSVMCSLLAKGPEASPIDNFFEGYQEGWQVSFCSLLLEVLDSCHLSPAKRDKLMIDILSAAKANNLDTSSYGGESIPGIRSGHLLQIFVRRELVDQLAYASHPFGAVDDSRQPLSQWLDGSGTLEWGQARFVANPEYLLKPSEVHMLTVSADPTFHANRAAFQRDLRALITGVLHTEHAKQQASAALYGGVLPEWLHS